MDAEPFTLVCFAVKEEAGPFRAQAASLSRIETLITGMGARNAEKAIRDAIAGRRPTLVLTCGFAGGLRPGLEKGEVIVSADPNPQLPNARSSAKALRNSPSPRPSPQGEGDLATAALAPLSLESALLAAGARAGKFHCAAKVATTKAEKRALWESTGADAVDMESQVIREICEK